MSGTGPVVTISPRDYDAVLFDMDGVLTKTVDTHASAWKKLFDRFLSERSAATGEPFVPFDIETDYQRCVDGKPRYDGVAAFLRSRNIDLPRGSTEDGPDVASIHGLGKRKDLYFMEQLRRRGVQTFEAAIELVRALRAQDVRTAVATSSMHCAAVLEAAGIADLFDARVDGNDLVQLGLRGKPAPDAFMEAARRISAAPPRAVIIEDAEAGVAAGHAGRFGLVVGVDHVGRLHALREAGADVVVTSLAQIRIATDAPSAWSLVYEDFDAPREGIREALCALGNGYFETRGAMTWCRADGTHYPGAYLAGAYNRLRSNVEGRVVENEDLVNLPNWLELTFSIEGGDWFDMKGVNLRSYRQELDLRRGTLVRKLGVEDVQGRCTEITERRFVSMSDMHVGAVELTLKAENWSGQLRVRSGLDGRVVNAGAKLYRKFEQRHLVPLGSETIGDDGVLLRVRTSQSDIRVAQAARTRAYREARPIALARQTSEEPGYIAQQFDVALRQGEALVIEKLACLYSSRDHAIAECGLAARKAIERIDRFQALLANHVHAWQRLWRRFDVHLEPVNPVDERNVRSLLRLNMFHLLQATSFNSLGLDIGVPARAWTGEAYQGHIFWDEAFIFPFLNYRAPVITRSLLLYRYRRLPEARLAALRAGYRGAMFPWQSGSDGQEETQELNFNERSRRWIPDNSFRQRHVGSAIAYNVWQYFQVTRDVEFMQFYGAELILDIASFWSSIATFNEERQRYDIRGVMGPDEFHETYPDSETFGIDNNAYTNVMAVWVLLRARDVLEVLPDMRRAELLKELDISQEEIARWDDITRRMFVPFHDGNIISQFEGYERLIDLDWENYRTRYGNIQRLDLILEAENDSTNRYRVAKQADVLMLFYVFSADELAALFDRMGYRFDTQSIPRNVAYYDSRSSHGSTLSRVVHAWVLARADRQRAMMYYAEALQSDVSDIQQGTAAEGVHLGAMAGTVDLIQRVSTGIEVTGDVLRLSPRLPPELKQLELRIRYRGHSLDLRLTRDRLVVQGHEREGPPIRVAVKDDIREFTAGDTQEFRLQ